MQNNNNNDESNRKRKLSDTDQEKKESKKQKMESDLIEIDQNSQLYNDAQDRREYLCLVEGIARGDINLNQDILNLIQRFCNVQDPVTGNTILHSALNFNNNQLIATIFENCHDVDVNIANESNHTPLHIVVLKLHTRVLSDNNPCNAINLILGRNPALEIVEDVYEIACRQNEPEIIEALEEYLASLHAQQAENSLFKRTVSREYDRTANKRVSLAQIFIDAKISLSNPDRADFSNLSHAEEIFLQDPYASSSALFWAIFLDHEKDWTKLIDVILKYNPDLTIKNCYGFNIIGLVAGKFCNLITSVNNQTALQILVYASSRMTAEQLEAVASECLNSVLQKTNPGIRMNFTFIVTDHFA
jgi:ankyrin repeat protein